jgi:hypothetical protein
LVLEDTVERIYHGNAFAEAWVGLFLIRGENVVLLGEIVRIIVTVRVVQLFLRPEDNNNNINNNRTLIAKTRFL